MIRLATANDAAAVAAIYAPIVACTPASFEEAVPDVGEMRHRIEKTLEMYPWLVWDDSGVAGYAYASAHRPRAAYRWSVEVSAYVAQEARGRGIGGSLYGALFRILDAQGFHRAFAGITLPNDVSIALHRGCGFETVGVFREVGYKLGAWRDTHWCQRDVGEPGGEPREPIPLPALERSRLDELIGLHAP